MANKLKVQIQETVEELEHRLERAMTVVSTRKITGIILACHQKNQNKRRISYHVEAKRINNISLVKSL
jgi:hypothetical protein